MLLKMSLFTKMEDRCQKWPYKFSGSVAQTSKNPLQLPLITIGVIVEDGRRVEKEYVLFTSK